MEARIVYHVQPAQEGWEVTKEGRRSRVASAANREQAFARARREAAKNPAAVVLVHGADFAVVDSWTPDTAPAAPG
jgi:hypothetical protein